MVDLPSAPTGTIAATEDRETRPTPETPEIRPAEERAETRDSLSESNSRRAAEQPHNRGVDATEVSRAAEVERAVETARAIAARPAEIAVRINEQRLSRLNDLTDLRRVTEGVGTAAAAVEVADEANRRVATEINKLAELGRVAAVATRELDEAGNAELAQQARQIAERIDAIAAETRFNDRALVDGSEQGTGSGFGALTAESLGLDSLDFGNEEAIQAARGAIGRASDTVQINRDGLRDTRAALEEVITQLAESSGALGSANGRSTDGELLYNQADRLAQQIRSQPGIAALATGNAAPVGVLSVLVGG